MDGQSLCNRASFHAINHFCLHRFVHEAQKIRHPESLLSERAKRARTPTSAEICFNDEFLGGCEISISSDNQKVAGR